jgi:hypothetical protein
VLVEQRLQALHPRAESVLQHHTELALVLLALALVKYLQYLYCSKQEKFQ